MPKFLESTMETLRFKWTLKTSAFSNILNNFVFAIRFYFVANGIKNIYLLPKNLYKWGNICYFATPFYCRLGKDKLQKDADIQKVCAWYSEIGVNQSVENREITFHGKKDGGRRNLYCNIMPLNFKQPKKRCTSIGC